MIRVNTSCIRIATVKSIVALVCWGVALNLASALCVQDHSILELTSREPNPPVQSAIENQSQEQSLLESSEITDPNARQAALRVIQEPAANQIGLQSPVQDELLPAPDEMDDEADYLMRAPLHEAFAEVPLAAPVPNPVIFRQPPAPIEEMPPEFKPEGENVVWISGYWYWDDERDDFLWVSGVWRETPIGQRWIAGYWNEEAADASGRVGYRWVNGFWYREEVETLQYLPQPPAPLEIGPSMPAPSDDYFYVPGSWMYQQSNYVWRPGYYSPFLEDLVWVPPTYIWTPCGYVFRAGYWDRPLQARGVVFAPVYFRQPIFLRPNYFFRPRIVINTGLGLLPHLFVRRNRCHYYFGDWYAPRYLQRGFYGWSNFGNAGFYRGHYDPLFNYYGSPFARHQGLSVALWSQQQHRAFAGNPRLRPPVVYNQTVINQWNQGNQVINNFGVGGLPQTPIVLADTLERRAKAASVRGSDRQERFVRLDEQQQKRELKTVERDLEKQRRDWERDLAKTGRAGGSNNQVAQVPLTKVAANPDPARQARLEKEAARRLENQTRIQQKQAEATAQAQARRLETEQKKSQRQLDNQLKTDARQQQRDARSQGQSPLSQIARQPVIGSEQLPGNRGGMNAQPNRRVENNPAIDATQNFQRDRQADRQAERQAQTHERRQSTQLAQQERELRRQTEAAQQAAQRQNAILQRQADTAQRQAVGAPRRQANDAARQAQDSVRQAQENARVQQRQLESQQRQMDVQRRQMEQQQQQQRRQVEQQQRQAQDAVRRQASDFQRSQAAAQRQAQDSARRQASEMQRAASNAQRSAQRAERQPPGNSTRGNRGNRN
jgi:hypothetical protein